MLQKYHQGPSIKYVTLFLTNCDPPLPCHTLSHSSGPPKVRHTSRDHPIFSSTKNPDKHPLYKISLNGPRGFCSGVLFEVLSGRFCSGVVVVRFPFCQNTF